MHLEVGVVQRVEEAQALDVIHVEVREEHVDPAHAFGQARREPADPGAGIEHEELTGVVAHLDARRVPAVAHGVGARARE